MSALIAPALAYLIPCLYLWGLTFARSKAAKGPWSVHAVVALAGAVVNAAVSGWMAAAVSVAVAAVLFLILVFGRILTRVGTFCLPATFACLPVVPAAAALGIGLGLAAAWSAVLLRRAAGPGYLSMLTGETFAATGLTGLSGGGSRFRDSLPDPGRLPLPETGQGGQGEDNPVANAMGKKVALPAFLALSLSAAGAVSLLVPAMN